MAYDRVSPVSMLPAQEDLTLAHLIHLYAPKIFQGGMIKLNKCGYNAIITNLDDDNDRGWMEKFIAVAPGDIISSSKSPIPET